MKIAMKSFSIGLGIFALSAGLASAAEYYPISRVATPEGYSLTAVQQSRSKRDACIDANRRFTDSITSNCAACRVEASQCKTRLSTAERAAAAGKAVKNYSVAAKGIRIVLSGSKDVVKTACEQIAGDTVRRGISGAACVNPGAKP
jgi:hypothetical protein